MSGAVSFCPYEHRGVKRMKNDAIAEDEGDDFGFIPAMKIEAELDRGAVHSFAKPRRHCLGASGDAGNSSHADACRARHGLHSHFSGCSSHFSVRQVPIIQFICSPGAQYCALSQLPGWPNLTPGMKSFQEMRKMFLDSS